MLDGVPEQFDEDDNHSDKVAEFLNDLKDKQGENNTNPYQSKLLLKPPTVSASINWEGNLIGHSSRSRSELRGAHNVKTLQNSNSQVFEDMSVHRSSRLVPQNQIAS